MDRPKQAPSSQTASSEPIDLAHHARTDIRHGYSSVAHGSNVVLGSENGSFEQVCDGNDVAVGENFTRAEDAVVDIELLSDQQMQQFIVDGYLLLPPREDEVKDGLGLSFHARTYATASACGSQAEVLGNNILPEMPDLVRVFESRRCKGALKSILGPDYLLHPHRFCHKSSPGRHAQAWHRDSCWGNWHPRNHCPYWIMALYFPQDTPELLGPTGILPRSQYYNKDEGAKRGQFGSGRFSDEDVSAGVPARHWYVQEKPLSCVAGTIALIHYDLWHRGAANASSDVRFMFKFQFSRMLSPAFTGPTWNHTSAVKPDWDVFIDCKKVLDGTPTETLDRARGQLNWLKPVWQGVWEWLCSGAAGDMTPIETPDSVIWNTTLKKMLPVLSQRNDNNEPIRVAAAWKLGRLASVDPEWAAELVLELDHIHLHGRTLMQVLEALGPNACPTLLKSSLFSDACAQKSRVPDVVRALGRIFDQSTCVPAEASEVVDFLGDLYSTSEDANVRLCAAEALGCLRVPECAWLLLERLRSGAENVGDVRATALHSLLRLLQAGLLDEHLENMREQALAAQHKDSDRYVTAYAAEVVHRIDHRLALVWEGEQASCASVPPLIRWCTHGNGWGSAVELPEQEGLRTAKTKRR